MRVIKSSSGLLGIQKLLTYVQKLRSPLVLWQLHPETQKRTVSHSEIREIKPEEKILEFSPTELVFDKELPLYCYSEEGKFIFKTKISALGASELQLEFPAELRILESNEIDGFIRGSIKKPEAGISTHVRVKSMAERTRRDRDFLQGEFNGLSLDEEDKIFADKRESPRARPKADKWVKLRNDAPDVHYLRLFDLSRGGLSFISLEPHLFPKGSQVVIIGFEDFDLDDPLLGEVMSQRAVDETEIEHKVGVKFNEGQS
jgi:hypothetical protein